MNTGNAIAVPESGLRWLFVDMNSFFASCEQQMSPDLRGQPVAVAPVLVDTTCAIAASYEAKAYGIKTGTPIWEARKRCPHIKVVQARPKLYVEHHHRIREAIETCIPIEAVMSIDEVACKLDRVQTEPKVAKALALAIK
jgi:DNA polymerase IV